MRKVCKALPAIILIVLLIIPMFHSKPEEHISGSSKMIIVPDIKLPQYCTKDSSDNTGDITVAILGSDERKDEISRSDVIMVIKYMSEANKVIVVSVPRDCRVNIPGKGICKINSAYAYGGAKLQTMVLEELFSVDALNYIHFSFDGFEKIIDSLGGIRVYAKKDFQRNWGKKNTYAVKGENILFGEELLEYVRFRHDKDGDFGRIERQQQVLDSLYEKFAKPETLDKLPAVLLVIARNSDSNMDIFSLMRSLKKLKNPSSLELEFYTLKTHSKKSDGIWYEIIDEKSLSEITESLASTSAAAAQKIGP